MTEVIKTWVVILSLTALVFGILLIIDDIYILALIDIILLLSIALILMLNHKTRVIRIIVPKEIIVEKIKEVPITKVKTIIKKIFLKKPQIRTRYYGHSITKIYHKPRCMFGKKIALTNLMKFISETQARRRKYHQCQVCF